MVDLAGVDYHYCNHKNGRIIVAPRFPDEKEHFLGGCLVDIRQPKASIRLPRDGF